MKKKMFLVALITLIWTTFIFYNSSNNGFISNNRSNYVGGIIKKSYKQIEKNILYKFHINEKNNGINILKRQLGINDFNVIIRKNAHFFEYMVLAILIGNCYKYFLNRNSVINMLFICLVCAVIDEFNQSFVIGRTSSIRDVLIDFGGSLLGIAIFETWRMLKLKKNLKLKERGC